MHVSTMEERSTTAQVVFVVSVSPVKTIALLLYRLLCS